MSDVADISVITAEQMGRAIPSMVRRRLVAGQVEQGADVVALRRFLGLT